MPAIVVDRLERAFGEVLAVRGIDLEVDEGETYAFLGPNGVPGLLALAGLLAILGALALREMRRTNR